MQLYIPLRTNSKLKDKPQFSLIQINYLEKEIEESFKRAY